MTDGLFDVVCDGPGPHDPHDGVLGEASVKGLTGMRCAAPICQPQSAEAPTTITVQVDPDALDSIIAAGQKATTVSALRTAFVALGEQLQQGA